MKVEVTNSSWDRSVEHYLKEAEIPYNIVKKVEEFKDFLNVGINTSTETHYYIEIQSLEQLLEFKEKVGFGLVILDKPDCDFCIEIYDDYRE